MPAGSLIPTLGRATRRRVQRTAAKASALTLGVLTWLCIATAHGAAADAGIAYLERTQEAGGQWVSARARAPQVTALGLEALEAHASDFEPRSRAAQALRDQVLADNDARARVLAALSRFGDDTSVAAADVIAARAKGGGWGLTEDFAASPLDTSLALHALARAGRDDDVAVLDGLSRLLEFQQIDGGWSCTVVGTSDVSCTAQALLALNTLASRFGIASASDRARAFLRAQIGSSGAIGAAVGPDRTYDTALGALALLQAHDEIAGQRGEVEAFILAAQRSDGSWDGDPLNTAAALLALEAFASSPFCGDGSLNTARESCDGADLGVNSCQGVGFGPGVLGCTASCQLDTSACGPPPVCGDQTVNRPGEVCDGTDLNGATCASLGFDSGALSCGPSCGFDTSGCALAPTCGDAVVNQASEVCDGSDLAGHSCASLGLEGGTLNCRRDCRLDTSGCTAAPVCGDGVANQHFERCDGLDFRGATCASLGGDGGHLRCASDCVGIDTSACTNLPDQDADGFPAGADCDDADPSVNPGRSEIPLNGKDDDCDARTLDVQAECGVEVVFTMDTSGSMGDESAALCNRISQVQANLATLGINAQTHLWGISGTRGGGFSCLTTDVRTELGSAVPGNDASCDGILNHTESWGQASAVVAERFPWIPEFIRVVVPISDEGPCNGNSCRNPGSDRDAIVNGIDRARLNDVFISPIVGTGANSCVSDLAHLAANDTGGRVFVSTNPSLDLASAISELVVDACQSTFRVRIEPALAIREPGTRHDFDVVVSDSLGSAIAAIEVDTVVAAGPNLGFTGAGPSDTNGLITFGYDGAPVQGVDQISATILGTTGQAVNAAPARVFWDHDCDQNAVPDTCDLSCTGFGGECADLPGCGLGSDVDADGSPDACRFIDAGTDDDYDGSPASEDCNDSDPNVGPGADEVLGNGVDDDCNPLTPDVVSAGQLACTLIADKVTYLANDTMELTLNTTSLAPSAFLAGLELSLTVISAAGDSLFGFSAPLSVLAPRELSQRRFSISLQGQPPGAVSARATVRAAGQSVASCSLETAVDAQSSIQGALSAVPDDVLLGTPSELEFTLRNAGNAELAPAAAILLVVDPNTNEEIVRFDVSVPSLAPGAEVSGARSVTLPRVGDFVAVLLDAAAPSDPALDSATLRAFDALPPIDDLRARAKSGTVNIVWTPVPGASGYTILRSDQGGPFAPIASLHQTDYAVYADYAVTNGVTYTYMVRWLDSTGAESEDSNQASATPNARPRRR